MIEKVQDQAADAVNDKIKEEKHEAKEIAKKEPVEQKQPVSETQGNQKVKAPAEKTVVQEKMSKELQE